MSRDPCLVNSELRVDLGLVRRVVQPRKGAVEMSPGPRSKPALQKPAAGIEVGESPGAGRRAALNVSRKTLVARRGDGVVIL